MSSWNFFIQGMGHPAFKDFCLSESDVKVTIDFLKESCSFDEFLRYGVSSQEQKSVKAKINPLRPYILETVIDGICKISFPNLISMAESCNAFKREARIAGVSSLCVAGLSVNSKKLANIFSKFNGFKSPLPVVFNNFSSSRYPNLASIVVTAVSLVLAALSAMRFWQANKFLNCINVVTDSKTVKASRPLTLNFMDSEKLADRERTTNSYNIFQERKHFYAQFSIEGSTVTSFPAVKEFEKPKLRENYPHVADCEKDMGYLILLNKYIDNKTQAEQLMTMGLLPQLGLTKSTVLDEFKAYFNRALFIDKGRESIDLTQEEVRKLNFDPGKEDVLQELKNIKKELSIETVFNQLVSEDRDKLLQDGNFKTYLRQVTTQGSAGGLKIEGCNVEAEQKAQSVWFKRITSTLKTRCVSVENIPRNSRLFEVLGNSYEEFVAACGRSPS
jgi:hypothetical protein